MKGPLVDGTEEDWFERITCRHRCGRESSLGERGWGMSWYEVSLKRDRRNVQQLLKRRQRAARLTLGSTRNDQRALGEHSIERPERVHLKEN